MSTTEIAPELRTLLLLKDDATRRDYCAALPDATLADLLRELDVADIWDVLSLLSSRQRAEVFGHLDLDHQVEITESIGDDALADLLTHMSADERVDLFKELPEELQESVLPLLAKAEREDIRKLSSYSEGTAGSVMTSAYVTLPYDITVSQALEKLRRQWPAKETIYYAYVVDAKRRLMGFVSLRKLIFAKPEALIGNIMQPDVIFAHASDSQEEAARIIAKHDLIALPVVNGGDAMVGIITHDDALDVVTEEATEDILRMAATDLDEYENPSVVESVRRRTPWLVINLLTAMCSSFVVSRFQDTIASFVVLAALMPIIAGLGGNAGTQTLALTVRGIALGKIPLARGWQVILREAGVGLLIGSLVGLLTGAASYLWFHNPWLGVIMFLAMTANILIAGICGSAIPLTLKALRLDPALGSSVFITAATDVSGFLTFLGLATLLLARL